jgi:uncharacterized protein (TIGR03435 family)
MTYRKVVARIAPVVLIAGALFGQTRDESSNLPVFDVASVKGNTSYVRSQDRYSPAGYAAANVSLKFLIYAAYGLPDPWGPSHYLAGGPQWLDSDRYDIEARVEDGSIPRDLPAKDRNEKIRLMLRELLADRFHLKIHRETRQVPIYALVVAKNGPKLRKAALEEKECLGIPIGYVACQERFLGGMRRGIRALAVDMSDLAQYLSGYTDRPIVDQTGIQGLFEIKTGAWSSDQPVAGGDAAAEPGSLPTLFTMLQEDLGLKLEAGKGPVEIVVIDRAEKPTDN